MASLWRSFAGVSAATNHYVLVCFMAEWLVVVAFSRYARFKTRAGEQGWGRWCLLPVYEIAVCIKKCSLLLFMITWSVGLKVDAKHPFCVSKVIISYLVPCDEIIALYQDSTTAEVAVGLLICLYFLFFYSCSYMGVLYVLCAASVGTRTLRQAVIVMIVTPLIFLVVIAPEVLSHCVTESIQFITWFIRHVCIPHIAFRFHNPHDSTTHTHTHTRAMQPPACYIILRQRASCAECRVVQHVRWAPCPLWGH